MASPMTPRRRSPPCAWWASERRAERAAGVAGRGLHPDMLEGAVAQHLAVGDAIERDAAGEAEILHAGLARERAREPQHDFLGRHLDGGGEVHVALRERSTSGLRGGPPNSSSNLSLVMVRPVQ